nr:efflux RND transporter periplasmic adaptor subunit [uncultured Sphingomonas sp.]
MSGTKWAALLSFALLTSCGSAKNEGRGGGPAQVGYVVVQSSTVPLEAELDGRAVAFETSEVRPQVSGVIRQRYFSEGGYVRKGQPLYQIDPSLYRAAVDQASANLSSAQATAQAAGAKAERYRPLAKIEAVSQQDYADVSAAARQARAAVAQNQAALRTARINLNFTNIPAPISGRIGRSLSTVGALATANQSEPLAVIQRTDPIYVDIQQSAADMVRLRQSLLSGGIQPGSTQVRLTLDDGTAYGYTGTVQFSEVLVDENTGTVTLRAQFPNPQGLIMPGMFVRARFIQGVEQRAMLVPQQAVMRDLGGKAAVFVVSNDGKAVRRVIETTRSVGTNWVVTSGLKPGDKVITQGLNNLRTGAAVKAVPASTPQRIGAPASAAAAKGR